MTTRQQWVVVAVVVTVLVGGAFVASRLLQDELTQITVGSRAPNFTATTLGPDPVVKTLADYRNEVVLLNIWATWCIPCRAEMPSIEALHQEFGPKGLKAVAVSVDRPGMESTIRDFVQEYGLTFEILYDSLGAIHTQYRTSGVPETIVIGRDGTIRKKWVGEQDWNSEANRRLIERLLEDPRQ